MHARRSIRFRRAGGYVSRESVDACPSRDSCHGPGRRRALAADHLYSRWAVTQFVTHTEFAHMQQKG